MAFVARLRDAAVLPGEEELPLREADRQARALRAAGVRLGCQARYRSIRRRVVGVQTDKEVLRRVTHLRPEELSAADVARLCQPRWQIERFFRWVKGLLGCRPWLAESPPGVAIEIDLALIGPRLPRDTGQAPNRRMLELLPFDLLGVASLEELWAGGQRERARGARRRKSETSRGGPFMRVTRPGGALL